MTRDDATTGALPAIPTLDESGAHCRQVQAALCQAREYQRAIIMAYADLAQGLDKGDVTRRASARVRELVDADFAGIGSFAGDEVEYWVFEEDGAPTMLRVHTAASLTGEVLRSRRVAVYEDLLREPLSSQVAAAQLRARALLLAPLLHNDRVLGMLMAGSRREHAFSEEHLHAFELMASVVASVLASAEAMEERELLVAERSAAVDRVAKSEALFRALSEHSEELLLILDPPSTIRYASGSIVRILGYSPDELVGKDLLTVLHPHDASNAMSQLEDMGRAPDGSCTAICRMRHRDGSWRHIEGTARNLLHVPAVHGIACNMRDVTERVNASKSIEFQAKLLSTVEQSVIAIDMTGVVTYWNGGAERLYGWSPDEMIGTPLRDRITSPEWRDRGNEIMREVGAGHSWTGEFEMQRRDGSKFMVLVTDTPIFDADGTMTGVVGVSTDISERRNLESQLRHSQKMEAVGQLAGGVAHDFNNILTVITSYTDMILSELQPGGMRDDLLEVRGAAHRAAELTGQLLAFSRKQVMRVQSLDMVDVVRSMEKMFRRVIRESIIFDAIYAQEPAMVMADRMQIEQVLMNLVVNARDAMSDGGHLRIMVGVEPSTDDASRRVVLRVLDTGSGMSESVRARIFEPFFTTKGEGKGTGLGLAVVYGIIQQLGGSVEVNSVPGQGTDFRIELPLVEATESAAPARAQVGPVTGTETILLVEDNEALAEIAARVLARFGYTVIPARNGTDAQNFFRKTPRPKVDLVVTDVVMPECSGPELVKQLAAEGLHPRVLYMSGYADPSAYTAAELDASAAFLPKPWTPYELAQAVRRALGKELAAA